jgi:hypothetical protein
VPTPTGGNRKLLTVVAFLRAAPGGREELKAALEARVDQEGRRYVNYDRSRTRSDVN